MAAEESRHYRALPSRKPRKNRIGTRSIQALVVFPDVMKRLNDDVTWTTNLGNAFLAQQPDVMDAVQRMRLKAQAAGKLASTSQETVATSNQGGQTIVEIEPADPGSDLCPGLRSRLDWDLRYIIPTRVWYWPSCFMSAWEWKALVAGLQKHSDGVFRLWGGILSIR